MTYPIRNHTLAGHSHFSSHTSWSNKLYRLGECSQCCRKTNTDHHEKRIPEIHIWGTGGRKLQAFVFLKSWEQAWLYTFDFLVHCAYCFVHARPIGKIQGVGLHWEMLNGGVALTIRHRSLDQFLNWRAEFGTVRPQSGWKPPLSKRICDLFVNYASSGIDLTTHCTRIVSRSRITTWRYIPSSFNNREKGGLDC